MLFAHRGLEPKPLPGVPLPSATPVAQAAPAGAAKGPEGFVVTAPSTLSRQTDEALGAVQRLFRAADGRRADLGRPDDARRFRALGANE